MWKRYVNSVTGYKFSVWSDGNPYLDDYVGHPFMGAITNALWIQNDPKGMTLEFSNTKPYWRSRLRALAFSTVYSTEWKLGPIGESGVGHQGDHISYDDGHARNETGFVSLVTTPVGGTLWTITEDIMDKKVVRRLDGWNRNPFLLMGYSFLTPAHTTGESASLSSTVVPGLAHGEGGLVLERSGGGCQCCWRGRCEPGERRGCRRHDQWFGGFGGADHDTATAGDSAWWDTRTGSVVGDFVNEWTSLGGCRRCEVHAHRCSILLSVPVTGALGSSLLA